VSFPPNDDDDIIQPTTSKVKRRRTSPQPVVHIICTQCGSMYVLGDHGVFCKQCGQPWKMGTSSSSPTTVTTSSIATTHPTTWAGRSAFVPNTVTGMIRQLPARESDLAPLPASVISKARAGQQYYTTGDLLPMHAHDASAASSSLLDEKAILMRVTDDGGFKVEGGIDATLARTQHQRRRKVTSFDQIIEVIVFSLMALVYYDRPDICEQLFSLLTLAHDINRRWGWEVALAYVDAVRRKHFSSYPTPTHVLLINTSYSMADYDYHILDQLVLQHSSRPGSARYGPVSAASGRQESNAGKFGACRNWNRGVPCVSEPCRWSHMCSKCRSPSHIASNCSQTQNPSDGTAATPGGSGRRSTKGKAAVATNAAAPPRSND
jgi:hypothetical protein